MQNIPTDILRLLCYYLDWDIIFKLSFCCKSLNFLSKDKKLLQHCVDKKYPIDEDNIKEYHRSLLPNISPIDINFNIMDSSTLINNTDEWLVLLRGSSSWKKPPETYYLLQQLKYRKNLVEHFIKKTPRIYNIPKKLPYIISQQFSGEKITNIKNMEDITSTNKDEGLNILLDYFRYAPKEYDILQINQSTNYLLIKNSHNILCRYIIKYGGILPIRTLKLLKYFNVKERKDISWLYPKISIYGIKDEKGDTYHFYDNFCSGSTKTSIKLSYSRIEHEIYISKISS